MESVTADAPVNIAVVKYCEYRCAVLSIDHWLCGRLGDKPFGWHASDFWATRRLRLQEWLSVVRRGGRAGCSPRLALCNRLSWTVCKMGYLSNVRNLSYPTLGIRQWFPIRLSYSMLYIFLVLICVTRLCIVPRHVTARYKSSFYYDYYYYYYYPVLVSGTLVSY